MAKIEEQQMRRACASRDCAKFLETRKSRTFKVVAVVGSADQMVGRIWSRQVKEESGVHGAKDMGSGP